MQTYILNDKNIVMPCPDMKQWQAWHGANKSDEFAFHTIAFDKVGTLVIRTFFLGSPNPARPPAADFFFQTMVVMDGQMIDDKKCMTYGEAMDNHKAMIARYKKRKL